MPTIPTYEGDYVAPGQVPGLKVNAPSAAQIDAGVSGMLAHVADASKQIYVQMSETRAEDTANKFYEESRVLTNKYQLLHGEDAVKGHADYQKGLADLRDKYAASLQDNAYAAHTFKQNATRLEHQFSAEAENHVRQEGEKFRAVTAEGQYNRESQIFIKNLGADDTEVRKAFFAKQKIILGESADEKQIEEQWNLVRGKTLAQVGTNILNSEGPKAADDFLKKQRDRIDPTELATLDRLIETRGKSEKAHAEAFNIAKGLDITGPDYESKRLEIIKNAKDYETTVALNGLLNVYDGERKAYVNETMGSLAVAIKPGLPNNGWTAQQMKDYDNLPEQAKAIIKAKIAADTRPYDKADQEAFKTASGVLYGQIEAELESGNRANADSLLKLAVSSRTMTPEHTSAAALKIANYQYFKDSEIARTIKASIADIPDSQKDLRERLGIEIENKAINWAQRKDLLKLENKSKATEALVAFIYEYRNKLRSMPGYEKVPETSYVIDFAPSVGTDTYKKYADDRSGKNGPRAFNNAIAAEQAWLANGFVFVPAQGPTEKAGKIEDETPTEGSASTSDKVNAGLRFYKPYNYYR